MPEETTPESSGTGGRLYSVGQITLATFLGAPLSGSMLLAWNYRALGKVASAWKSFAAGAVSTLLLVLIGFWLPENFPNMALPLGYCVGMRQLVQYLQGGALAAHLEGGGRKGSWVVTVAAGLGCLGIIFGLTFVLLTALDVQ